MIKLPFFRRMLERKSRARNRALKQISQGIPPCLCVDVGASYYPPSAWSAFLSSPNTCLVAVEPNTENLKYLKNWKYPAKVKVCGTGLSGTGDPRTLYVTSTDSGSSLNPPVLHPSFAHRGIDHGYFFPLKEKLVKTETLENVLASHAKDLPVVIKLDTQGTELEILHGGITRLQNHQVVGVEMEAPLLATPVMKGSGRFWEANRDLESWGYELLEIKPYSCATINKTSNQIGKRTAWECDAVFALRRDVAQDLPETFRRMLVFFYLAYEFYEEALSFLEQDSQVSESLTDLIKTSPIDVLKKTLELQE